MAEIEIYDDDSWTDTKKQFVNPLIPQPDKGAFAWILLGPSKAGKSTIMKNILFNPKWGYDKYFDEVYAFIGSLDDLMYLKKEVIKRGKEDEIDVRSTFNGAEVSDLYKSIEKDNLSQKDPSRVLFIFDDMITEGISSVQKANILDKIMMKGRHACISIIISTQKYMSLNDNLRCLNVTYLTVFDGTDLIDLEHVATEHGKRLGKKKTLSLLESRLQKKYESVTFQKHGPTLDSRFQPL
jgi:hypothetical protein